MFFFFSTSVVYWSCLRSNNESSQPSPSWTPFFITVHRTMVKRINKHHYVATPGGSNKHYHRSSETLPYVHRGYSTDGNSNTLTLLFYHGETFRYITETSRPRLPLQTRFLHSLLVPPAIFSEGFNSSRTCTNPF